VVERGVEAACRERVQTHCERAVEALAKLPGADGVAVLEALAQELGERRC